jgi:imidazoleglycerol-phosphate dehydratase
MSKHRRGDRVRETKETRIAVSVDLDGTGAAAIATGVGFYDHLLTSLATHSLIDIEINAVGDIEIDDHHTVEDVALALGGAISDALGDRAGISRFGAARVPMDESLAQCALDLSGRPYAVVDLPFRGERMGELATQMV